MAEIGSNVRNIAIRVRVLLSHIDRAQVELSKLILVGTRGVPLPVHNIIVAVAQTIPDLQKKWTRFGDNRRVYAKDVKSHLISSTHHILKTPTLFYKTTEICSLKLKIKQKTTEHCNIAEKKSGN